MNFKSISTLALACFALLFASCEGNNGGSDNATTSAVSKPAAGPAKKVGTVENSGIKAYDPGRETATVPAAPTTTMEFASNEHNFGTLEEGESVTHIFTFTNTGSEPLVIDKCKGSCGCTVPLCPKTPIAPGAVGVIEVKFNSKNKKNDQKKTVTINANTDPGQTFLTIKAFVNPVVEPIMSAK